MKYIAVVLLLIFSVGAFSAEKSEVKTVGQSILVEVSNFSKPTELFEEIQRSQLSSIAGYFDFRGDEFVGSGDGAYLDSNFEKDLMLVCPKAVMRSYLYSRFGKEDYVLSICTFLTNDRDKAFVLFRGSYAPVLHVSLTSSGDILSRYMNRGLQRFVDKGFKVKLLNQEDGKILVIDEKIKLEK